MISITLSAIDRARGVVSDMVEADVMASTSGESGFQESKSLKYSSPIVAPSFYLLPSTLYPLRFFSHLLTFPTSHLLLSALYPLRFFSHLLTFPTSHLLLSALYPLRFFSHLLTFPTSHLLLSALCSLPSTLYPLVFSNPALPIPKFTNVPPSGRRSHRPDPFAATEP